MLQGFAIGMLGENATMGTLTPPPERTARPAPPSRFDAGRPAPPMGPSGRAILFGLFALAVAAWLLMRPPTQLAATPPPRRGRTPHRRRARRAVRRREGLPHRLRRAVVRPVQGLASGRPRARRLREGSWHRDDVRRGHGRDAEMGGDGPRD